VAEWFIGKLGWLCVSTREIDLYEGRSGKHRRLDGNLYYSCEFTTQSEAYIYFVMLSDELCSVYNICWQATIPTLPQSYDFGKRPHTRQIPNCCSHL